MSVLAQILKKRGIDPVTTYGCTNYVCIRFTNTMNAVQKSSVHLDCNEIQALVLVILNFINNLKKDKYGRKTYFIPYSGTYELLIPTDTYMEVVHVLQAQLQKKD